MFGYSALLDNSLGEKLSSALSDLYNILGGIPFYWYILSLALLVFSIKFLTKR